MNQVYVCSTYFHVYVSILKSVYRGDKSTKSLIVINDRTPGIEKIFSSLKEHGFFDFVLQVPFREISLKIKKDSSPLSRMLGRNKLAVSFVEKNSEILKYDEFIRKSEINLFPNLGLSPTYFLLKYKNNFIRMLEDGEGNYFSRIGHLQAFKRKYLLNTVIGDGLDKEVREIEVQFPEKLSPRLKPKGKKLELKKMQDSLSIELREKILKTFMQGFEMDLSNDKNKLLLLTQPLEEKYMTEDKKIKLYNEILDKYAADYNIFIKPHPRELTDYKGKN